jgi:hypothetical protein
LNVTGVDAVLAASAIPPNTIPTIQARMMVSLFLCQFRSSQARLPLSES